MTTSSTPTARRRFGGILPAHLADLPLDFDTLQPYGCFIGSAAIIVLTEHDRARDAAWNMMRFFRARIVRPVHALPRRHRQGRGADGHSRVGTCPRWTSFMVMRDASICGLGQAAPNP